MSMSKASILQSKERYKGFRIDPLSQELRKENGEVVALRSQSMEVFKLLASNPNGLVPKEEIIETIWVDSLVTDDSLIQCIADIRRAIGDTDKSTLLTVQRKGYRLLPDTESPRGLDTRNSNLFVAVFSPIVLLASLTIFFYFRSQPTMVPNKVGQPAIAIQTFENLSEEPRWDRFSLAIKSDLATTLAKNSWLKVILLDENTDLQSRLFSGQRDVFLLSGTLQPHKENLRVLATLSDSRTGEVVWSQKWDKRDVDLFRIQDDILNTLAVSINSAWNGVIHKQ